MFNISLFVAAFLERVAQTTNFFLSFLEKMMNFFSEKKTDKEELIDNIDDNSMKLLTDNEKTNFDLTEVFSHLRTKQEQRKGLER